MVNEIISSISEVIYAEFGDKYEIYKESVKQGLNEPCFLISCINPKSEQFLGTRYFSTNQFSIQFFGTGTYAECNDVAEQLFETLEYITVDDDLIRGTSCSVNINSDDYILSFFVNYDTFMHKKAENQEYMEEYSYEQNS